MEDLKKMYVDELRALAIEKKVPGASGMKKAELIAALESGLPENQESKEERKKLLFRKFGPGSEPVEDGSPPEPPSPAGEKIGEPIPAHKSNREKILEVEEAIRQELTDAELSALSVLAENGWLMLTGPRIENAASRTSVRSFKAKGRYRIGCVKNRIMR